MSDFREHVFHVHSSLNFALILIQFGSHVDTQRTQEHFVNVYAVLQCSTGPGLNLGPLALKADALPLCY